MYRNMHVKIVACDLEESESLSATRDLELAIAKTGRGGITCARCKLWLIRDGAGSAKKSRKFVLHLVGHPES